MIAEDISERLGHPTQSTSTADRPVITGLQPRIQAIMNLPPEYTAHNIPPTLDQPDDINTYFSLSAPPNSSIWRKSSSTAYSTETIDCTTAPMILKRLTQPLILAEVTISADFAMDFDQAGLVIFAGALPSTFGCHRAATRTSAVARRLPRYFSPRFMADGAPSARWAKAGLEFTSGEIHAASTVALSASSDWASSARLPPSTYGAYSLATHSLRVKFERVDSALWIWYHLPTYEDGAGDRNPAQVHSAWRKMREVAGFFGGVKESVWVGCYASRPMDFEAGNSWEECDGLVAEFEDLDIL